jgi:argininosuccinate lyase
VKPHARPSASLLFELALLSADLGRLAADLMLFYMEEIGYVSLPEDMTTGSSIMPQKRNPDIFELVRAAPATVSAALVEALAITSKLPSGYHRDLQRLKSPLFRGIDLTADCLAIMAHALPSIRFNPERITLGPELYAAEKANELVLDEGLPFREAYRRVAMELNKARSDK